MDIQTTLDTGRRWLSEKDAITYSCLSRTTLRKARDEAKLTYRLFGSKILYLADDIDKYIIQNSTVFLSVEDRSKGSF